MSVTSCWGIFWGNCGGWDATVRECNYRFDQYLPVVELEVSLPIGSAGRRFVQALREIVCS